VQRLLALRIQLAAGTHHRQKCLQREVFGTAQCVLGAGHHQPSLHQRKAEEVTCFGQVIPVKLLAFKAKLPDDLVAEPPDKTSLSALTIIAKANGV
jgi:hypothetical protein